MARVLPGRVLGVVDHQIRVGHEPGVPAVPLVQDRLDAARLGTGAPELIGERFVVHQIHDRHAVGFDSVAHRHGRMIEKLRRDSHAANHVDALGQVVVRDRGW